MVIILKSISRIFTRHTDSENEDVIEQNYVVKLQRTSQLRPLSHRPCTNVRTHALTHTRVQRGRDGGRGEARMATHPPTCRCAWFCRKCHTRGRNIEGACGWRRFGSKMPTTLGECYVPKLAFLSFSFLLLPRACELFLPTTHAVYN